MVNVVESEKIPGLYFVDLSVHQDNRGSFKESFNRTALLEAGLRSLEDFVIVQNNVSINEKKGTIRGMHAEPWEKYISPANGTFFGAWVDLRVGDTYGNVETREVTPSEAVFVPRGVANGFQALTNSVVYSYLVNEHWSLGAKKKYVFVNFADPELGIRWPLGIDKNLISEDDLKHPMLKDARSFTE